jgi:hypothetical protein
MEFPEAPANQDSPVWEFVREWQGANISPILRPTYLPPGFDVVTIDQLPNKLDVNLLTVTYSGAGKTLSIEAGGLNPPPPDAGGYQEQVLVRNHDAVFEVDGRGGMLLWWGEPGLRAGPTSNPIYLVSATGLTKQDILRVAESLIAVEP